MPKLTRFFGLKWTQREKKIFQAQSNIKTNHSLLEKRWNEDRIAFCLKVRS